MRIASSSFRDGAPVPARHSCEGEGMSPPLTISDVPPGAKSLAIICDDPDAPAGTFVHWVVWDIRPDAKEIPEGAQGLGVDGSNDFGKAGYGGPCPPRGHGPHRYFFKAYALDRMLGLKPGSSKAGLERSMEGHILAKAELVGTYER